MLRVLNAILIFFSVVSTVRAEQVMIIDEGGLIRLSKFTSKPISVVLEFECNPLERNLPTPTLEHEDGLLGDTDLPWSAPCMAEARNIPPGRWKLIFKSGQVLTLKRVTEITAD